MSIIKYTIYFSLMIINSYNLYFKMKITCFYDYSKYFTFFKFIRSIFNKLYFIFKTI
jgi:hypothetical protein